MTWNIPHIKPIHVSTILWTCPQKCGHWPNTNFICKIAVVHTRQNTCIGCFLWYVIQHNGTENTNGWHIYIHMYIWTHKLMHHCPYEYNPPVHKHMSPVHLHNSCNIHQSNLRKTSVHVLKLFQDKNQLLINTQT